MADIQVTLVLDDSQYTGKIRQAGTAAEDFGKKATKASGEAGAGFEMLRGKMESLVTVLLGAGFVEFGRRALDLSDRINDLSKGSDISIPKILQLREAFEANGGSADGLSKIIQKLNTYLYDAKEGSAQAQESLLKLGLTFKDMANLDTGEALAKTIDKLAEMTNATDRNALALRVFGREAKNINWAGIREGTTSSTAEYDKYAKAIEEAGKAHDKLAAASEKLLIAFTNLLEKSGILKAINNMNNDMDKFEKIVLAAGVAAATVFGLMAASLIPSVIAGFTALNGLLVATNALMAGMLGPATAIIALAYGLRAAIDVKDLNVGEGKLIEGFKALEEQFAKLPKAQQDAYWAMSTADKLKITEMVKNGKAMGDAIASMTGGGKAAVKPAWAGEIQSLSEISDQYERLSTRTMENYNITAKQGNLTTDQAQKMNLLRAEYQKYEDQLDAINKQIRSLEAGPSTAASGAKIAQLKEERTQVSEFYDTYEKKLRKNIETNQATAREFNTGWTQAFSKYIDDATNAANQGRAVFDVMSNAMNSAIDEFVMKGTFSFKSFSTGIIQELEKIALKAAMAQVFKASGLMDFFGGGKASGGTIPSGTFSLVGENGPELVKGPASVTNAPNTADMLGGGGTTIINNISAIDSRSVAQLFAENRMTLFGTVEQARRELPMRTR